MQVRMSRTVQGALFVVVLAVGVTGAQLLFGSYRSQPLDAVPYTSVLAETTTHSDGRTSLAAVQVWATRSDGSTYVGSGGSSAGGTIQFASGTRVQVQRELQAKSTVELPSSWRADRWLRDPRSRCLNNLAGNPLSPGEKILDDAIVVGGHRAVKIARPSGTLLWYAVDVGCALIRSEFDFGSEGRSEAVLVVLSAGEPSDELFIVPSDFREGPPSSLVRRPPGCDAVCEEQRERTFAARDREYYANRSR